MTLRLAPGTRLVAATHNSGKARELEELLGGRFDVAAAGDLGLSQPEETETTFIGNAVIKARAAAQESGLIAIADDSGLCVEALDGAPGVHSARWAGPDRDFARAIDLVERRVEESEREERGAWFICALAVAWPSGTVVAVEGRVDGALVFPGRGERGFGYDPIFIPDGLRETFGEMAPTAKHKISHRARAFAALEAALF